MGHARSLVSLSLAARGQRGHPEGPGTPLPAPGLSYPGVSRKKKKKSRVRMQLPHGPTLPSLQKSNLHIEGVGWLHQ